jgi:hypothetical protein
MLAFKTLGAMQGEMPGTFLGREMKCSESAESAIAPWETPWSGATDLPQMAWSGTYSLHVRASNFQDSTCSLIHPEVHGTNYIFEIHREAVLKAMLSESYVIQAVPESHVFS